ncbi:unnamed protein product [Paramecium primaurelia]|uniref:SURP motif domain-containing protein n=2 Tax=Paramecium TaxID=5884 RepID=A0A8S1TQU9_9CILI|nr:unnamed protein product [Paramecium primaurelia]CAD8154244.1 unnamed protein product [Paramecium pentaurelia]
MVLETQLLIKNRSSNIVIPPPNIKKYADKTAEYVAKNGATFEDLVMQKELSNPNFCFLRRDDPYRPYYENKITEFARGLVAPIQEEEDQKTKPAPKNEQPKKVVKAPPNDQYTVEQPRNLSALDLDIIKHTAIFIAKNGKKFLVALTEREKMNPQYDFLKPTHDLFQFFSNLVDAYTKCLQPKKEEIDRLLTYVQDRQVIYQRCQEKYEYDIYLKEEKDRKQQQDEDEKQQMAMIDWNDFTICETIDFAEDDRIDKVYEKGIQRFDKMDFKGADQTQFQQQQNLVQTGQVVSRIINNPQQPKEKQIITLNSTLQKAGQQGDSSAPIISNYQRPTSQNELVLIKCEICGKNFPKNQINEHIQLELQDPRYSEIKKEINERSKTTTLQPGNMIAEHLSQLKKKRPDIFEEDHRKPPPPPPPQQRPQPPRPAPPPPPPPPK